MRSILLLLAALVVSPVFAQQLPAPPLYRTSPAANDNSARAATTSFVQSALTSLRGATSTWTGSNTFSGPLASGRTITYSGGVSPANSGIYSYTNFGGAATAGSLYMPANPFIVQDTASLASSPGGSMQTILAQHNTIAGAGRGIRAADVGDYFHKASTGSSLGDSALQFYHGGFFKAYVQSNDGGDAANKRGSFYGVAGLVQSDCPGPCHLNGLSNEFDVSANANTTLNYKFAVTAIAVNGDASKAVGQEALIMGTRDPTTKVGFNCGLCFGFYDGYWPIDKDNGTILGTLTSKTTSESGGIASPMQAKFGVDFNAITFTTAAFRSPGFVVAPNGVVNAASFQVGSPGSPSFQVNGSGVVRAESSTNAPAKCVYVDSLNQLVFRTKTAGQACNHDS